MTCLNALQLPGLLGGPALLRHQRHQSNLGPDRRTGQHGLDMFITLLCRLPLRRCVGASLQNAAADQDGDEEGSGDEADKVSKRKRKQEARLKVADLKTVRALDGCAGRPGSVTACRAAPGCCCRSLFRHAVPSPAPVLTRLCLLWASCAGLVDLLYGWQHVAAWLPLTHRRPSL